MIGLSTGTGRGALVARNRRQRLISRWAVEAFGADQALDPKQRALRLLEEAIEAYQAAGADPAMAHSLIDFVFSREPGNLFQELGGVGVCVLCLAEAAQVSADYAEAFEVDRIGRLPSKHFTARNDAKNSAGFLAVDRGKNGRV